MFNFLFLTLSIQQRNSKICTHNPFAPHFLSLLTTCLYIGNAINSTLCRKVPFNTFLTDILGRLLTNMSLLLPLFPSIKNNI